MQKFILLIICALGGAISLGYINIPFVNAPEQAPQSSPQKSVAHKTKDECTQQIIMYSQTNCSVCKAVKKRLNAARIPYRSYDIDKSPSLQKSVGERAIKAGIRSIHIPMFEAGKGKFLSGRTSVETLKQYICDA